MRKKLLAAFLSGAMVAAVLTGCGGNGDSAPAEGSANTETDAAESTADDAAAAEAEQEPAAESAEEDTAAGAESIVSGPTELTYIFADGDEGAKASMNEIVNKFNETYPDITVTIEPGNGGAYSEFIKTKDSVGEFPDVMEMRDTAMYVPANWSRCLTKSYLFSGRPRHLTVRCIRRRSVERTPMALSITRHILTRTAGRSRRPMTSS